MVSLDIISITPTPDALLSRLDGPNRACDFIQKNGTAKKAKIGRYRRSTTPVPRREVVEPT